MPSASVKLEKQGSQETLDPLQKVTSLMEKKIRNLEKRKNKLEQYRLDIRAGKELNQDQQQAVRNYDCVLANLELMRELSQQFSNIVTDHNKIMKKQLKREQIEKQQEEINKVKEILKVQDVLQRMGQEEARADFLAGTNGAVQMPSECLDSLDELYKLVSPSKAEGQTTQEFQAELQGAAEHLLWLLEGRNKNIARTTYKALLNVVDEIASCSYPERKLAEIEEEAPVVESEEVSEYTNGLMTEEIEEITPVSDVVINSPVSEAPPPGLAAPSVVPMLSPTLPQESAAVSPAQEALVAAMAQMTTAPVPGAPPQAAGMPPAPSYFTQAPPQPSPQPAPPQQAPQQPPPPQQTPLQPPPPPPQLQPISLNDLVAPGSFDFLQESQVAQDPPTVYMDPAVVSIGSIKTESVPQRSVSPVPQQTQQVAPMVTPNQEAPHASNIPTQTFTNQTYNVVSYSQGVPVYSNSTVADSTPNPPPPIPMPPQARPQEKVEFNPEASPWTGQQVPAQQPAPPITSVPPPPQEDDWVVQEVPVNGGDDKWGSADNGNWDEYEDNQGVTAAAPTNGHGGEYERRGNFRSRGRGFGGRGGFRGVRGGYQNGRGGYGGYGGYRGGRGGMGGPRGGRGFRGQGLRGTFRGRGGGYQGQRPPYQQQHQQQ
ncbi:uncharacterized protein [Panulirus ornatus]|uniref:uncharacterized protein n=1 Tax=Panulirus ornatus TaxID=150431 RepID=UPI003A8AF797